MMTLDKAIIHYEKVAEAEIEKANLLENRIGSFYIGLKDKCERHASENRQLADWLKDYKRLLEKEDTSSTSIQSEILEDGTLVINLTPEQLDKINRVLLESGRWCKMMYMADDEQPEQQKSNWILKKELVSLPWDSDPLDWDNYDEKTHSEWKEYYHCSNCDWKSGESKGGNFCPNCGADMRGEDK